MKKVGLILSYAIDEQQTTLEKTQVSGENTVEFIRTPQNSKPRTNSETYKDEQVMINFVIDDNAENLYLAGAEEKEKISNILKDYDNPTTVIQESSWDQEDNALSEEEKEYLDTFNCCDTLNEFAKLINSMEIKASHENNKRNRADYETSSSGSLSAPSSRASTPRPKARLS